eukprot:10745-Heterococcus_DN1.PRE.5
MNAKKLLRACLICILIVLSSARSIYDFTVNTLAGEPLPLSSFQSSPVSVSFLQDTKSDELAGLPCTNF